MARRACSRMVSFGVSKPESSQGGSGQVNRPRTEIIALAILVYLVSSASSLSGVAQDNRPRPQIGIWYTTWWDVADKHLHWRDARELVKKLPSLGIYNGYDSNTIRTQFQQMKECGVDFIIFDDTNTIFVDDGIV